MSLFFVSLFFVSCSSTTQEKSQTEQDNSSSQSDQVNVLVADTIEEEVSPQQETGFYSLTCQGIDKLQLGQNVSSLKKNFEASQVTFWEDGIYGSEYRVSLEKDIEVSVWYDDQKDNTINMLKFMGFGEDTPRLTFEDVYVGMSIEELNTYLATPVACSYNKETGFLTIEGKALASSSNNTNYECIYLSVDVGNNEAFVVNNPTFKSDMPEFLELEPIIIALYIGSEL